jgi:hypothetical protein
MKNRIEMDKYCEDCRQEGHLCRQFDVHGNTIQCARCGEKVGSITILEGKLQDVPDTGYRY